MIIPTIHILGRKVVQVEGGQDTVLADDPISIALQYNIVGTVALYDLDAARGTGDNKQVILDIIKAGVSCLVGGINNVDAAIAFLNKGALAVIVDEQVATADFLSALPKERVILALKSADHASQFKSHATGFAVNFAEAVDLEAVKKLIAAAGKESRTYITGVKTVDEISQLDKLGTGALVGTPLFNGSVSITLPKHYFIIIIFFLIYYYFLFIIIILISRKI